jgi:hypothetical protein
MHADVGKTRGQSAHEFEHLRDHETGYIDLALRGLTIRAFECICESSCLGASRHEGYVIMLRHREQLGSFSFASAERACGSVSEATS